MQTNLQLASSVCDNEIIMRKRYDKKLEELEVAMTNKEITIKDVAKQANVSVATVSRVMNGRDRVSRCNPKENIEDY